MMKENRSPSVVLKHYDFDSSSDIEHFNSKSDSHKLYMSPSCKSTVSDKGLSEKNFYLKKSSQKILKNCDSPLNDVPKRVSFSNHSRVLYFSDDADTLYSEIIVDNVAHTSEQTIVDQSSSTESKDSEISSEDKPLHPMEKDLVIVLEKLPVDLVKKVKKENCDLGECFQSVKLFSDNQNSDDSTNLQSTEFQKLSQESELTKSFENILSNGKQKLTSSNNSSSELNTSLHQELKVSIQRLPNHLLELHLTNNSFKSFEGNLNSSNEGNSYDGDLLLTKNKVSETEVNDLSPLKEPAIDTDSDSSYSTLSKPLRQGSCVHENGVHNCDLSTKNPCVKIERLNRDVYSSHCTQNELLKKVSCQDKISIYNSDVPVENTCVLNETINGDVNLLHSNEPLKQEPSGYESNASNSDVSIRNPLVLSEALNEQANSSYSTSSKSLKEEPCEHEGNVYHFDVSARNPCVLIERLNEDVYSSHCTQNELLKQVPCQDNISTYNSDVPVENACVLNETLNGDVNLLHSNEPLKQEPSGYESNANNLDVPIRNSLVLNEALNGQANSLYSTPSKSVKEEPCEHESNVYNFDVSVRNPCVLKEALNTGVISSCSTKSEPLMQESCNDENNVHNSDISTNNPSVPNEALNRDMNPSCPAPSEPVNQESCNHEKDTFNYDISKRKPYVLLERLDLIVPNMDNIQSTEKFQKGKRNDKDIFYNEQNDINSNLVETESNIVLGSADKHLMGSSKLSKASKGKKRPTVKSGSAGNNPKCLSNAVKESNKKSKSQLEVRNKTAISLNNIRLPSHKVAEIIPVDSHNLSCATNVVKQCSLTKTKRLKSQTIYKHTEPSSSKMPLKQKSCQYKRSASSSEDDIPLTNLSKQSSYCETLAGDSGKQLLEKYSSTKNQSYVSDNSSSEDDMALSLLSKPQDVEHTNNLCNQEKSKFPSSYLKNSSNIKQTSQITNLNASEMSTSTGNQYCIPNFTSSEDDMPLSLVHELSNVKQTKITCRSKKKKRLQESKKIKMQKFTDFNVMHMTEMMPPNCIRFMSDFIKKMKTPAVKKIDRNKLSKEEMLLFSRVNDMNNIKQMKISGNIEKKAEKIKKNKTRKMQKFTEANLISPTSLPFISDFKKKVKKSPSTKQFERKKLSNKDIPTCLSLNGRDNVKQTSGNKKKKKKQSPKSGTSWMQNFTDFNVVNAADRMPPNSVSFKSDLKKKVKKSERKIPPKQHSFLCSSEIDPLNFVAQVKECNLKKPLKSGAKKRKKKQLVPPKQTKLNCINGSTLISHYDQASSCKNNSALHLKIKSDDCYYETVESDTDCDILQPMKKVKLDNNKFSCNVYEANKEKSTVVSIKNGTISKELRKEKYCQSKNKRTSNELHISLRNYLNKFFTEFDSIGVSKKRELDFSQQENKMVKKRERIYKLLISEMFHHLKNTCSIKKSYKQQRLKEKLNKRSSGQLSHKKLELDDFSSLSAQTKGDSQKREGNKENHTNKFQLGFLTSNKYLKLYNRCVAAERLILLKYKMKKEQRRKIKRFFKTLKKNSLKRN